VHRIGKDHRFIGGKVVQLVFILLDEGRLFRRVQLARDRCRLAVFHAKSVQQCDQPGPGLVFNTALARDPRANRTGRAWQSCGDPGYQLVLLLHSQPAAAAFMAEARETLDPIFLIQLIPGPDRVLVEKQHLGYGFATHAIVEQHQRIRTPRQTVRSRTVARQLNQVATRFVVQPTSAYGAPL
jgi:hypothetical protein